MEYTHLGRLALKVSRLCLGTMNFNPPFVSEADSFAIMDAALEAGINFFDTADVYGFYYSESQSGLTEEIIGRWLAHNPARRRQIVLATKVYGKMGEGVNDQGLSAYHIRQACEDSLRRLQTDHIDLYQMHHVDRSAPWEEVWQAMETLIQQGKVIYVGSSNFGARHIARAQCSAAQRNLLGLVSEQSLYNLIDRHVELEVLPACREYGMGFLPWSPLKSGMLAGVLQKSAAQGRQTLETWMPELIEKRRAALQGYEDLCRQLGEAPAVVGLAWLLHQPGVTAPVIGPRSVDQLHSSLRAVQLQLPDEALQQLDALFPGPGGESPEAYAW